MNESLTLARHISNIRYDDLPGHVVEMTKQSILDANTLGEGCRAFVDLAIAEDGKKERYLLSNERNRSLPQEIGY